jgi:hypothetical protein
MAQIKFITSETEFVKTAKGGYNKINVTYKDPNGKIVSRGIFDFAKPAIFKAFKDANANDLFDVEEIKNDKGYWEFVTVTKSMGPAVEHTSEPTVSTGVSIPKATGGVVAPRSNYETPEERAFRQRLIVRQSSIGHALEFLPLSGEKKSTKEEVIKLARYFESFVYGEEYDTNEKKAVAASMKAIMDMPEGIEVD